MPFLFNDPSKKAQRQSLRRAPTKPEQLIWQAIRGQQLGVKFRRQVSVGPYIVDFYSYDRKLAIEIDGDSHFTKDAEKKDTARTTFLAQYGIRVVRFTNREVTENLAGCVEQLQKIIAELAE